MVQSIANHLEELTAPLKAVLHRRLIPDQMDAQQLKEHIKAIMSVLESIENNQELEKLNNYIDEQHQFAVITLKSWCNQHRQITFDKQSPTVEFPTNEADVCSAHQLAQQWYQTWLVDLVRTNNKQETELEKLHSKKKKL